MPNNLITFLFITTALFINHNQCQLAPKIDLNPNSIVVNVSDPVTLECRASGKPTPKITWFKDGAQLNIDSSSQSKYTLIHDSNLFIFSAALGKQNKSDAGVYYCKAENDYGHVYSTNATLIIAYLKEDFREVPKSRQVNSGSSVVMECKAPKGYPEPVLIWEKNGQVIKNTNQNGTLIINNAGLNDNGEYVCIAKNDAGHKRSPAAHLNVFEKPSFIQQPETSKYQLGTRVELKCQASGFPKPQIEWKKDSSFENLPLKAQIRDNSLIIPNLELEDEGEYTCVATNQLASVEAKSYLIAYEKPTFLKTMSNLTVGIETKSITIECNARGRPQPVIYWAKSAQSSSSSASQTQISQDDFIILENGNLFIERLSKKYEGTYLCQASNEYGNIETKTYLQVKPIQLKPPPVILYQPQNQTIPINTQATIECTASSPSNNIQLDPLQDELQFDSNYNPNQNSDKIQIQWFKNDKLIDFVYDNSLKYLMNDYKTLIINSVQKSDSAYYKCVASNHYGQTSSLPAYLNVENPNNQFIEFQRNHETTALPSAPTQPIIFKITSKSVILTWQASSHSGHSPIRSYMIEYFSPEWPNNTPGWIVLTESIPAHINSFTVDNLTPDTYYMFMIRARNDQGYGPPSQVSDIVRTQIEPMFVFSNKNSNDLIEKALTGEIVQLNEPADVLSSTSINITWKLFRSSHLIQGFYIKYKPIGSRDYLVESLNTNKQNFYVLNNLAKFTAYEILVEPFSGLIKGSESNIIQAKTKEDMPSHSPVNLNVDLDSLKSISIKWQSPPQNHLNGIIIGYKISCVANETKFSLSLNTNSTTRAIILGNLIEGMKYCVKVAAYTKVGLGPYTAQKCVEMNQENLLKSVKNDLNNNNNQNKIQQLSTSSKFENLLQEVWFLVLISLIIGLILFTCSIYLIWFFYKRKLLLKNSNSKKYLSNNSTLSNQHKIDQNGNRYKLVGNDTQIWLDTLHSGSNQSNQDPCCCVPDLSHSIDQKTLKSLTSHSPQPQYAEIYAPNQQATNPYATTGLFIKNVNQNDPNLYNILNYPNNRLLNDPKYSSYTIKLLNDGSLASATAQHIDQKKLLKYIHTTTQSQTNTPKIPSKNLSNRVKSVEASNNQNNNNNNCCLTQQQLLNYLVQINTNNNNNHHQQQQPSLPIGPPPSLPTNVLLNQQQTEFNFINNNPYNLPWTDQQNQTTQNSSSSVFQRVLTSNSTNSNSSSLVSNLTGNSTLSRNSNQNQANSPNRLISTSFTAQQYMNRTLGHNHHHHHPHHNHANPHSHFHHSFAGGNINTKNMSLKLNQQQQIQQDYSSISPEDELIADEFRYIQKNEKINLMRRESIMNTSSSNKNRSDDLLLSNSNSNSDQSDDIIENFNHSDENENYFLEHEQSDENEKKFIFLHHHQHRINPNEIYISDEMPQTVL